MHLSFKFEAHEKYKDYTATTTRWEFSEEPETQRWKIGYTGSMRYEILRWSSYRTKKDI